jgi:hypothetical protein
MPLVRLGLNAEYADATFVGLSVVYMYTRNDLVAEHDLTEGSLRTTRADNDVPTTFIRSRIVDVSVTYTCTRMPLNRKAASAVLITSTKSLRHNERMAVRAIPCTSTAIVFKLDAFNV